MFEIMTQLMSSDIARQPIESLTSVEALWLRNSFAHFAFGYIAATCLSVRVQAICFALYGVLQVIQTVNGGFALPVLADGIWDMICPLIGTITARRFAWKAI